VRRVSGKGGFFALSTGETQCRGDTFPGKKPTFLRRMPIFLALKSRFHGYFFTQKTLFFKAIEVKPDSMELAWKYH
jgi:hypothetical protein